jgi:hypothetical protein
MSKRVKKVEKPRAIENHVESEPDLDLNEVRTLTDLLRGPNVCKIIYL